MRILFLDDDPKRRQRFRDQGIGSGHEVVYAETPDEATQALERRSRFDLVSLDHDLFGKIYQPSDEKSGFAVCQFLRKLDEEKLPDVILCHSYNEQGVANMMGELAPLIEDPFMVNSYAIPFDSQEYWERLPFKKIIEAQESAGMVA